MAYISDEVLDYATDAAKDHYSATMEPRDTKHGYALWQGDTLYLLSALRMHALVVLLAEELKSSKKCYLECQNLF